MSMNTDKVIKKARKFAKPFRITKGEQFRMKDVDTLASLDLAYPQVDKARLEEIASAKRALLESK